MAHLLIAEWLAIALYILGGAVAGYIIGMILAGLIGLIFSLFTPDEATSIAILGSKGSGKTTLWDQLRGEFKDRDYYPTEGSDPINEFIIEHNGVKKTIKKTLDFSGDDQMVKRYNELIEEGTYIYYLIDLTMLEKFKRETRSRLQVISKIAKEKNLGDKAGCRLIGTNYRKYNIQGGKSRDDARHELCKVIRLDSVKDVNVEDKIMILELTDKNDVNEILDQIIK